ncbi:hypothetical protein ACFL4V_02055 [Candidatus Latescibacterota bacterium]
MEETSYSVIFRGEIAEGQDIEEVKKNLAELFKVKSEKIERLFSDKPAIIKKNVDHTTAMKYKSTLEKVGALCSIVPSPGETDVKPFEEAESEKKPSQSPDIKESESATAPALSIPPSLNVISPEHTLRELCFSPMQCPSISRAGNNLNFNRADIKNIQIDTILLVSVFAEEEPAGLVYRLVLFLKDFKRPFISNVDTIRYNDFPGVKYETTLKSFRNFILYLLNKNPDIIIDKHTEEFLQGNEQNLLAVEPLDFITSLGKSLEK